MNRITISRRLVLAVAFIAVAAAIAFGQKAMNRIRQSAALTESRPLENAPPIVAFTTIALGGFRGLLADLLFLRLQSLKDDEKFFEMVQLASWIVKL